jgi:hypothetical protein
MSIDANPSIKEIATTFGDTPPYSMSELYGLNFSSGNAVTSGTISLSGFRNKTVETLLAESNKLTADNRLSFAQFGTSVSVSSDGSTLLVGAPGQGGNAGAAYIFEEVNGTWTQQANLTLSSSTSFFGISVYISHDGSTALVGASGFNDNGSAYIFEKGSAWSDMTETAKLTASDGAGGDNFGRSVSISSDGSTAFVGSPYDNSSTGSAYIFEKGSSWSSMTETTKLTASNGAGGDYFGDSVSISDNGSTVLVGAYRSDSPSTDQGSGYIFEKVDGTWIERAQLTTSDTIANDKLGTFVSLSGDGSTALMGSEMNNNGAGAAYIFEKPGSGWTTTSTHTAKLTAENIYGGGDYLGICLSISGDGNTVIAGAPGNTSNGSAYIFKKPDSGWSDMTETAELKASDGASGDRFGWGVCISDDGSKAIIGSYRDDNYSGSAYVFDPTYFVN